MSGGALPPAAVPPLVIAVILTLAGVVAFSRIITKKPPSSRPTLYRLPRLAPANYPGLPQPDPIYRPERGRQPGQRREVYSGDIYSEEVYGGETYGGEAYGGETYGGEAYGGEAYGREVYGGEMYSREMYSGEAYNQGAYSEQVYNEGVYSEQMYGAVEDGREAQVERDQLTDSGVGDDGSAYGAGAPGRTMEERGERWV